MKIDDIHSLYCINLHFLNALTALTLINAFYEMH